jgi:DnaJ-class molecular chaperone
MKDPYSILGISSSASDEEVKNAYRELAKKYHPDNYKDDNPLKELADEKMQEINSAYDEIQKMRAGKKSSSYSYNAYSGSQNGEYATIRRAIAEKRFAEAEKQLYSILEIDRTAEWHYLASIILMQRNRPNDAMRELEIACNMDPSNMEYQRAKEMFNTTAGRYGSDYYYQQGRGVRSASSDACDCCTNLICLDCLCECMGGDLIRCI